MKKLLGFVLFVFHTISYTMEEEISEYKSGQGWDAREYYENSGSQLEKNLALVRKFMLNISSLKTILDVGCGNGMLAAKLAELAPESKVIGIDISEDMVSTACQLHAGKKQLVFIEADIQSFDLPGPFDLIVSFACFHFLTDHQAALHKISAALKHRGLFLLTMATKCDDSAILKAYLETIQEPVWDAFKDYLLGNVNKSITQDELFEKFTQAGLRSLVTQEEERNLEFETEEKFSKFIAGWAKGFEGVDQMNQEQQEIFINSVVRNYLALQPADKNGKVTYRYPELVAYATKW